MARRRRKKRSTPVLSRLNRRTFLKAAGLGLVHFVVLNTAVGRACAEERGPCEPSAPDYCLPTVDPDECVPSQSPGDPDECDPGREADECWPPQDTDVCAPPADPDACKPPSDTDNCAPPADPDECYAASDTDSCVPPDDPDECVFGEEKDECLPPSDIDYCEPPRDPDECKPPYDRDECLFLLGDTDECIPNTNDVEYCYGSSGGDLRPVVVTPETTSGSSGELGGVIDDGQGTRIEIPPGALSETTTIYINRPSFGFRSTPNGKWIEVIRQFSPDGLTFQVPVHATIPYGAAETCRLVEDSLCAFWYDDMNRCWTPIASEVNTTERTVSFHTMHFSLFGIGGYLRLGAIRRMTTTSEVVFREEVTDSAAGEFFCEEADRSCGVRVVSGAQPQIGAVVKVTGIPTTTTPEMTIEASAVQVVGTKVPPSIRPVAMPRTPWDDVANCLLGRIWGKIVSVDGDTAVIDNGTSQMTISDVDVTVSEGDYMVANAVLRSNLAMKAIPGTCVVYPQ